MRLDYVGPVVRFVDHNVEASTSARVGEDLGHRLPRKRLEQVGLVIKRARAESGALDSEPLEQNWEEVERLLRLWRRQRVNRGQKK